MRADTRARARERLLAWYRANARPMPWRGTRDPYAVWVSEVMLQQTRVETVLRYWSRFLARFPTIGTLAGASEDEVLSLWSGLGYYRRARLLHAGAKAVVAQHGGRVPEDAALRRGLPSVGRYTAGAIGSIAFGLPEPIVDGNVARVLSRLLGVDAPLGSAASERALWDEAALWARAEDPAAVNQSLMELGATLCAPVTPTCDGCPLRSACVARRTGRASELPVKRAKKPPREVSVVAVVARDRAGRALLRKHADPHAGTASRAREGGDALGAELFRGLWSVPMTEGEGRADARALADDVGATLALTRPTDVIHVLTHRRLRVAVFAAHIDRAAGGARLVSSEDLDTLGIATLTRKLLAAAPHSRRRDAGDDGG